MKIICICIDNDWSFERELKEWKGCEWEFFGEIYLVNVWDDVGIDSEFEDEEDIIWEVFSSVEEKVRVSNERVWWVEVVVGLVVV